MIKVLKQDSETFKKLESVSEFLTNSEIEIHISTYNGLILKINNQYFKYIQESEPTDCLPPFFEGKYVLCDEDGNTDFYNE